MGVTDATSGQCTTESLADFISAWVGITEASRPPPPSCPPACLAKGRDDTTARAAANPMRYKAGSYDGAAAQ